MARTDNMRQQHKDLAGIVVEIEGKLNALPGEADNIRRLLSTLAGKLSVHLAVEDKNLYPAMIGSANAEAKKTAEDFQNEMGALGEAFKDYTRKWPSAQKIQESTAEFSTETKSVFQALKQRIEREENTLYPLADTI